MIFSSREVVTALGYTCHKRIRLTLCLFAGAALVFTLWVGVEEVTASGPWFVSPLGNDANDCQSYATACLTIGAAITKASSGDFIIIGSGTYTESLTLAKNLTLIGFGADTTTISGNHSQRVLYVPASVTASVSDLAMVNGNSGGGIGGGVWNLGTLVLSHTRVEGNEASNEGGGIANAGFLTLTNSLVVSNTSLSESGGGMMNYGGEVVIQSTTINHNSAERGSGGMVCFSGILSIRDSIIENNLAGSTYAHSPIPNGSHLPNAGSDTNGGNARHIPQSPPPASGGGLRTLCASTITNSAIINNYAPGDGGALENAGSTSLINVTVSENFGTSTISNGGVMTVTNVTIANNIYISAPNTGIYDHDGGTAALKNTILVNYCTGTMTSLGHNLDAGNSCGLNAAGDLTDTNPLLGPLQNNGGPTPTQALLPGSPAINGGTNSGCPATDQRGVTRPQAGICDIGAYELVFTDTLFLPLIAR